ncbi:MAG: hypothetical protein ABII22_04025 [Candidatus Micrarchaeota archaeon]
MHKQLRVTSGTRTLKNGKIRFENCHILQDSTTHVTCVRLGLDRTKPASFSLSSDRVEIAAHIRKKGDPAKTECQDSAIVIITPKNVVAGVFDGFGPAGTFLSENAASIATRLLRTDKVRCDPLLDVAQELSDLGLYASGNLNREGGTTAVLASVSDKDGGFCVNGAGDSAIYRQRLPNQISRLLNYFFDNRGDRIDEMIIQEYLSRRHFVSSIGTLSFQPPIAGRYECSGGMLDAGEVLLLASDGLTKNLTVRFNPETQKVIDVSGCRSLQHILNGMREPSAMVEAILRAINRRVNRLERRVHLCNKSTVLWPQDDDVALIAMKFHKFQETF